AASPRRRAIRRAHAHRVRSHRFASARESLSDGTARDSATIEGVKEGQQSALGERVNAGTIALVAGRLDSTDAAIAGDLATVRDKGDALRVMPVIGKGGGQNLRDVRYMRGVDLGIVPVNLLDEYRRSRQIGPIDDTIVYVTKLFNEEMHVLV